MTREEAISRIQRALSVPNRLQGLVLIDEESASMAIEALQAEPTVIRSRTLMPTKDFKEWAKRVREVNPNAVVIPCDAEVVSADAVQGEWMFEETDTYWRTYCSVCGASAPFECVSDDYYGTRFHGETRKTNFCPNCGADMRGDEE